MPISQGFGSGDAQNAEMPVSLLKIAGLPFSREKVLYVLKAPVRWAGKD